MLWIGPSGRAAQTVEKKNLVSRIDNGMYALAEHRGAAGPSCGGKLRQCN
jgi:hypothetical protein